MLASSATQSVVRPAPPGLAPPPPTAAAISLETLVVLALDAVAPKVSQLPSHLSEGFASSPTLSSAETGSTASTSAQEADDYSLNGGLHVEEDRVLCRPASSDSLLPPPPMCAPPPPPWAVPPAAYDESDHLWAGLNGAIHRRIQFTEATPKQTIFHFNRAPSMSINFYLFRIRKIFDCSDACAVTALAFMDRAAQCEVDIAINALTCHRLLLACMMVSAKFYDDHFYGTAHYAAAGYIQPRDLVVMERELLRVLSWKLHLGPCEYLRYRDELLSEASFD